MQLKLNETQSKRIFAEAELDTVQRSYNETIKLITEAQMDVQNKDSDLKQLQDECEMEIRTYHDKAAFLQHMHLVLLQDLKENEAIDIVELEQETDVQLSELLEAKNKIENEIKQRDLARDADLLKLKDEIEHDFEIYQRQLSGEAQSLKQGMLERRNETKKDLLLQLKEEKKEVDEQKDIFIKKISREHDECKQRMMSYYNEVVKDQRCKISKLRARVTSLQRERDSDIEMAQKLAAETCALEKPLFAIQEEVSDVPSAQLQNLALSIAPHISMKNVPFFLTFNRLGVYRSEIRNVSVI